MTNADAYLTQNIERGEIPRSRAFYRLRDALLSSNSACAFVGGLALGVIATLFVVLIAGLVS